VAYYREKKLTIDQLRAVLSFHALKAPHDDWGFEYASCAAVSDDGKWAVVADDSAVAVWDLATGKIARTIEVERPRDGLPHGAGMVVLAPAGSRAAVDFLGAFYTFDLAAGKVLSRLENATLHRGATFSNDGKLLALWKGAGGPEDRQVPPAELIDCATGKRVELDETFRSNQKSRASESVLSGYQHWSLAFGGQTMQERTFSSRWADEPRKHPRPFDLDRIEFSSGAGGVALEAWKTRMPAASAETTGSPMLLLGEHEVNAPSRSCQAGPWP
jgi:hypothetical protein